MDNVQLVIDTDIIVDFLRRRSQLLQKATDHFACGITAVTLYELLAVAVRSSRQERLLSEFTSFEETFGAFRDEPLVREPQGI